MRVGGKGDRAVRREVSDIDPLVDRFEEPGELLGSWCRHFADGGGGVGVMLGAPRRYFASILRRISAIEIPASVICIASRATSMQTPQPMP
jgi:hypothetical protein